MSAFPGFCQRRIRVDFPEGRDQWLMGAINDWLNRPPPRAHAIHSVRFATDNLIASALQIYLKIPRLTVAVVADLGPSLSFGKMPEIR